MSAFQKIIAAKEGPIYAVALNVPERRNAIGPQMTNELLYALEAAHADDDVRVITITGEGKAFCAGGDFQQMTQGPDALPQKGDYADLLLAMIRAEKPIVAKVNGHAMGGGLGLVAASHFAIAHPEAKLGTPEIEVGLFPFMIMAVLARVMPKRALLEMMLRGQKLSAEEARAHGLVSRVSAELDRDARELCADLAKRAPLATKLGLRAYAAQADMELERALPVLRDKLFECLATDDAREGLMAFMQKREPNWTGK